MLLKIIAFLSAAIPVFLFLRSVFVRKPSRIGIAMREAKAQFDFGINIFLGIVACVAAFALGKIVWTWWAPL